MKNHLGRAPVQTKTTNQMPVVSHGVAEGEDDGEVGTKPPRNGNTGTENETPKTNETKTNTTSKKTTSKKTSMIRKMPPRRMPNRVDNVNEKSVFRPGKMPSRI